MQENEQNEQNEPLITEVVENNSEVVHESNPEPHQRSCNPQQQQYAQMSKDLNKAAWACGITLAITLICALSAALFFARSSHNNDSVGRRLEAIEEAMGIEDTYDEDDDVSELYEEYERKLNTLYNENKDLLNEIRDYMHNGETAYPGSEDNLSDGSAPDKQEEDIYQSDKPVIAENNVATVIKRIGEFTIQEDGDQFYFDYGNDVTSGTYVTDANTQFDFCMVTPLGNGLEEFGTKALSKNEFFQCIAENNSGDYIVMEFDNESHIVSKIIYYHYGMENS